MAPAEIVAHLDLSRPGLEAAAKGQQASDRAGALRALLAYYRGEYPLPTAPAADKRNGFAVADRVDVSFEGTPMHLKLFRPGRLRNCSSDFPAG